MIRHILTIYRNHNYQTQVLLASARHPQHVVEAALAGGSYLHHAVQCFSAVGGIFIPTIVLYHCTFFINS